MDKADILNRLRLQKSAVDPLDSDAYAAKLKTDAANWNATYAEQAKKWTDGSADRAAQFDADVAKRDIDVTKPIPQIPDSERSDEWKQNFAEGEAFQKQTPAQRQQWEAGQREIVDTAPQKWMNNLINKGVGGVFSTPSAFASYVGQQPASSFDPTTGLASKLSALGKDTSDYLDRVIQTKKDEFSRKPEIFGEYVGQTTKANPGLVSDAATGKSPQHFTDVTKNWKTKDWFKFGSKYYQTDPEGAKTIAWAKVKQWLQNYWPVLAAGGVSLVAMYAMLSAKNKPQATEEEPTGPKPFNYARLMGRYN